MPLRNAYPWLVGVSLVLLVHRAGAGTTGVLEGRVVNQQSSEPLPGATVQILGTPLGAATDTEGFFLIANVRAGEYSVRFSAVGFRPVIMQKVAILPDLRTRMDIALTPSVVEMDAIEVTAERPLIQKDMPATAYSIGDIKLNKLPVTAFEEVLGLQPGTTVEGNVRGGKINEVVYLVDGLPIQDVVGGGIGSSLPKSSITGLTIHTGGFEAEYGNAMSGVVNVVTKTGSNSHVLGLRFEQDGWFPSSIHQEQDRAWEAELTAGGPIVRDELYYFAANTASFSDTRWWQDFAKFGLSPVSKEVNGFGKVEYLIAPTLRASLQAIYSVRRWRDYEFSWRFNLPGLPHRERDAYRFALMASHTLNTTTFYTISLSRYYQRSQTGDPIARADSLFPYEYDFFLRYIVGGKRHWFAETRQSISTIKGDLTTQLGRSHIVKAGAELHQYHIQSDLIKFEPQLTYFGKPIPHAPLLNYSNAYDYRPRSGSVYVQDKIELVRDGTHLSLGVRWDFLDPTASRPIVEFIPVRPNEYQQRVSGYVPARFKQQFSPRAAFAAPIGLNWFFFMNFGHYFQYPLFDYLYSGINPAQLRLGTRSVLTGNPDLEPERTIAWEIGFKHSVGTSLVGSVTYFRKSIKNQIDSNTLIPFDSKSAGDYGFAQFVNNAQAEASGIEFVIAKERGEHFTGSVSYAFMTTEGVSENVNQTVNLAQWGFPVIARPFPLSWDQRHTLKGEFSLTMIWDVRVNGVVLFNTARPYTYYPTRDGYAPLDSTKAFIPNNRRMENNLFINVKAMKEFTFDEFANARLLLYFDARNVLNLKNVRWIDSNGRIGGELGDPSAYYDPRRVRFGVRIEL